MTTLQKCPGIISRDHT